MSLKLWPGSPYPLGAHYDGSGTNFSLFSEKGERVELCLFDESGKETHIELTERTGYCWHGYIPKIKPGQRYGYRVHGPWNPLNGDLFNPAKLLLDPYAKAIDGQIQWNEALFPHLFGRIEEKNDLDSGPFMPKCVVHDPFFDWTGDNKLQVSWNEVVIYEAHVKGLTANHPSIPSDLKGSYLGLVHPLMMDYYKRLGITAIELMPIHHFVHDQHLLEKGLKNYWGYNTIGFFSPHNDYATDKTPGASVSEFKEMVKKFHQAGIEVILDVVYNHTAEGNHLGPILSFKGIDNSYYYRLTKDPQYYMDYTGTGNSLNMRNPHVLQLLMDSLRYWVLEMHVDGFRFDLASTLARELHDVDRLSSFFDLMQQDPIINQVKLIAEPWDVGEGGYQVGNFPPVWSEWNGKYRDCVRNFWRGEYQTLGEFASRFTGSSDLYQNNSRLPYASINYITAHDGFTLNDLVSYNQKNNIANGEDNKDGNDNNLSWNLGVEGTTDDPLIIALREKQKRNFLATLFLSQGIPMICYGDESGRTQKGNNNAYCQDNELSWMNWETADKDLLSFCQRLIAYRKDHPVFRRRNWFQGRPLHGDTVRDIEWFTVDGKAMASEDWGKGYVKSLGVFLNGKTIPNPHRRQDPVIDDNFYIIFNAEAEERAFKLPAKEWGDQWIKDLDTSLGFFDNPDIIINAEQTIKIEGRSLVVLRHES